MPSLLRRIFSGKTFVRLGWTIAALIALLIGAIAFENWRGDRAWAAYRADADKRGVPYQRNAFLPSPVPDDENFAAIPLFREIFAAHGEFSKPRPFQWPVNAYETPTRTYRPAGQRLDLAKLRDQVIAAKLAHRTENPAHDIITGLAAFEPAFQQLRDAARRPRCRFPVNWERGFLADLPHLNVFEPAVRLYALRLSAHLADGDSPAPLSDWRDVLALYRVLEHEPGLASGAVRTFIVGQMEDAIWDGLSRRQWAEPELHALVADFVSLNLLADWRFTLSSERADLNGFVEDLIARNPGRRIPLLGSRFNRYWRDMDPNLGPYLTGWIYPCGWYRQCQVKINRYYDRRLAQIDPAQGRFAGDSPGDEPLELWSSNFFSNIRNMLTVMAMPYVPYIEARIGAEHTVTQQVRTACALELFRRVHGRFPERLDELLPDFLENVPRDVMDGAPLRYRRTAAENFDLWSIGSNRVDDGGITGPKSSLTDQLDWVWTCVPAPQRPNKR